MSMMVSLDENPYEVGDVVEFTPTGNVGEVLEIRDDFCKVKFTDKESFLDAEFLKLVRNVRTSDD